MKKLFYILSAGLLLAAVACNRETPYQPGEPDLEGCYGVYFPEQDAATTHYFDPAEPKQISVTVKRTATEGAINVPYTLVGEDTDVFDAGELKFEDGKDETTLVINLKETADEAVEYPLTIEINDPQYASKYSANKAFISLGAMIVIWKEMGTFEVVEDGYWGEGFTVDIKYYEVDGVRYCVSYNERDRHPLSEGGGISEDGGFWGTGPEYELNFEWHPKYKNADGYDYVGLPANDMGYPHSTYGTRYYVDKFFANRDLWGEAALASYTELSEYLKDENPYGLNFGYYDPRGELTFFYECAVAAGSFGSFKLQLLKDGYVPPDYSIKIEAGVSEGGKLPINVTTGENVASFTYAIYEGSLGKAAVGDHLAALIKGTEQGTKVEVNTESTLLEVSLEKTGEYTIIVIPANKQGALQEANYVYTSFGFLAEGDEDPVVGDAGLESLSGKYVGMGYDPETALELWAYGKDIKVAKYSLFTSESIDGKDADEINAQVKAEGTALSADELEDLNGDGFALVIDKLLSGTPYTAIFYLSNGYSEKWFSADATTLGKPDPLKATYRWADVLDVEINKEAFVATTWDYYAKPYDSKNNTFPKSRIKLGTVTAIDGGVVEGEEIINLKGLSYGAGEYFGFDDALETDLYGGVIYTHQTNFGSITLGTSTYNILSIWAPEEGGYKTPNYAMIGGYVNDGLIAFVPSPSASSNGYTYCTLYYGAISGDSIAGFLAGAKDIMLADPAVFKTEEDAAAAIAKSEKKVSTLKQQVRYLSIYGSREPMGRRISKGVSFQSKQVSFTGKSVQADVKVSAAQPTARVLGRYQDIEPVK